MRIPLYGTLSGFRSQVASLRYDELELITALVLHPLRAICRFLGSYFRISGMLRVL